MRSRTASGQSSASHDPAAPRLFPGCQPLNLFGRATPRPAAVDYVVGNDAGQHDHHAALFRQPAAIPGPGCRYDAPGAKVNFTTSPALAELSAHGKLFDGLGRPDHRRVRRIVPPESTSRSSRTPPTRPRTSTPRAYTVVQLRPAAIARALRGVAGRRLRNNTVGIQFSKVSNIRATSDARKPSAKSSCRCRRPAFAKTLKFDLAARWADYSGSGGIWAYKGGVDWTISTGSGLRGTYSRDVRAANLSERFDKTGGAATVTIRVSRATESITVTTFSRRQPQREAREGRHLHRRRGRPAESAARASRLSVDWYRIKISDAIGQLGSRKCSPLPDGRGPDLLRPRSPSMNNSHTRWATHM